MMKKILPMLFFLIVLLSWMQCRTSTEPQEIGVLFKGTVMDTGAAGVCPAYLFIQDSLMATTDEQGKYSFNWMNGGSISLTCSALYFKDTTEQVLCISGRTCSVNFTMTPDSALGRVHGEFQDQVFFTEAVNADSSLKDWDARQVYDAATGATLQYKTLGYEPGHRRVFLGDSLMATSDAWAQFYFRIQCGTYPLRATVAGYKDQVRVLKVLPEERNYINFFMERDTDRIQ